MHLAAHGADREGFLAIDSLKKANVNVSYIDVICDRETNVMNVIIPSLKLYDNTVIHSWYSPITNKLTIKFDENLIEEFPKELQDNEVYLILDKFLPTNLQFLKSIKNKKVCLDVGHIRYFEHFTRKYLIDFFSNVNYMQLNHTTKKLLFERLDISTEEELFELLDLELLVLTNGKEGATFLYRNKDGKIVTISKVPEIIIDATPDTSGAGDAFFSTVVREYAYAREINEDFIDKTFKLANSASRDILSQIGSRK